MHLPSWNIGLGALLLMVAVQFVVDLLRAVEELVHWNFDGVTQLFNIGMAVLRCLLRLE